jgi:hypothetical protein
MESVYSVGRNLEKYENKKIFSDFSTKFYLGCITESESDYSFFS